MIDVDMTVEWRSLERALNTLPNAMAKGVLKSAMKKALKPVLADAESNAPVREGRFKKKLQDQPYRIPLTAEGSAGATRGRRHERRVHG
ncbi:unnamed protein product, partial [marine sediment metagenome]